MTDDQGLSNLACQGHPILKTPNIDKLADKSIQLTNFHQELLCAPSRSALMTGRYSSRTGAWRTSAGRAIMRSEETSIAELFKLNGYKTGHFGKWHLGDNYPFRSMDQGFDETVVHNSGGVGQIADYWGNNYFDDVYYHNGQPQKYRGYCADVWFNETMRFIKDTKNEPFFIYLASNTPHSPYIVDEKYYKPFLDKGVAEKRAKYFGMISNMDENMGRLMSFLQDEQLSENTIIVFTTDDGASGSSCNTHDGSVNGFPTDGYNAGLRGRKASVYDGGHHTFCYWHWPAKWGRGKEVSGLSGVWDVFPTLADLCDISLPDNLKLDGRSLKPLFEGNKPMNWNERTVFVQLHGGVGLRNLKGAPHQYIESAIIHQNWRLVNGNELYNIDVDRLQKNNIIAEHPEVVEQLKREYTEWFKNTTHDMNEPCRIVLGSDKTSEVELTGQDYYTTEGNSPFAQGHPTRLSSLNGPWKVEVEKSGKYNFKISRYPIYTQKTIGNDGKKMALSKVRVKIGDQVFEKEAKPSDVYTEFSINLEAGEMDLQGWFVTEDGEEYPTYFILVENEI